MSLVATLICHPANPALDSTVVDGARAILPEARPAHWLFDEVAVDIPFASDEPIAAIVAVITLIPLALEMLKERRAAKRGEETELQIFEREAEREYELRVGGAQ